MEIYTISNFNSYCHYCQKALSSDNEAECTQGYHDECLADFNEFMALKRGVGYFKELDISHNQLKKVPSYIKNLQQDLFGLDISHNQIQELPAWIGTCPKFSTLIAGYNNISKLSIDNLPKSLHRLDLSYNKIEYLPDIDITPNTIWFNNNPIKNIPSNWFQDNPNSKILDNWHKDDDKGKYFTYGLNLSFNNCVLTSLPDTLSYVNINTLSMPHNHITSLPADLGLDYFILKIDLSNNPISQLPECLFVQSNIFKIILNDTKIQYLPELGSTIKEVYLKNTPISEFPDLRNIKNLFSLDIRGTNIAEIPAYVKNIKISNVYIDDLELSEYFNSEYIYTGDSYVDSVSVKSEMY